MWHFVRTNLSGRKTYSNLAIGTISLLLIVHETYGYPQQLSKSPSGVTDMNSDQYTQEHHLPRSTILGPVPICKGSTFCEDVPNYPTEIARKLIKEQPDLLKATYRELMNTGVHGDLQTISVPEDQPLCLSVERVIFPKSAESINKEWLFILNNSNFMQSVRIETCMQEDSTCNLIDGFAEGYVTSCKQKYIFHQLTAIGNDGTVNREFFRFPSSCCCHVQFALEAQKCPLCLKTHRAHDKTQVSCPKGRYTNPL